MLDVACTAFVHHHLWCMQLPGRVGDPSTPCGNRGLCSLTSGTCGCFLGYAGPDCGECAKGYVRVDEHCAPYKTSPISPWWMRWFWLLLLIILCPCYCCCLILWCVWRRRKKQPSDKSRFVPHTSHLHDLKRQDIHGYNPMLGLGAGHERVLRRGSGFVRPDRIVTGAHNRRASASGYEFPDMITQQLLTDSSADPQVTGSRQVVVAQHSRRGRSVAVRHGNNSGDGQDSGNMGSSWDSGSSAEDRRIRQLTKGNAVWRSRRAVSVDGAVSRQLGYLLEFNDEGSLQQLPEVAACENFDAGALPSLAAAMEKCESDNNSISFGLRAVSTGQDGLHGTSQHSGLTPEQKKLSLAKRNLIDLYQGYGDDFDGSLHPTQWKDDEQNIIYCSQTATRSAAGAAVLAAHQQRCVRSSRDGTRHSELFDLLRKQPLERTSTGIEDFTGFITLGIMQLDAQIGNDEVTLLPLTCLSTPFDCAHVEAPCKLALRMAECAYMRVYRTLIRFFIDSFLRGNVSYAPRSSSISRLSCLETKKTFIVCGHMSPQHMPPRISQLLPRRNAVHGIPSTASSV